MIKPTFSSGRSKVGRIESQNLCNHQSGGNYLPVTRYESLYFKNNNLTLEQRHQQFCGKFYFYETDSDIFLNLGNCLVSANKVDAMIKLLIKNDNIVSMQGGNIINSLINNNYQTLLTCLLDVVNLYLPTLGQSSNYYYDNGIHNFPLDVIDSDIDNQLTTVLDFLTKIVYNDLDIAINSINFNNTIVDSIYNKYQNSKIEYVGDKLVELWDHLDQPICNLAKKLGYDTIILQREAGKMQVNSEILDTRLNSYDYLCKDSSFNIKTVNSKFNTIWFTDLGFYSK